MDSTPNKHLVGITGTVPRREHEEITGDFVPTVKQYSSHMTTSTGDIGQFPGEKNLAPTGKKLTTDLSDDPTQPVSADMGFCKPKNLMRRTKMNQTFQDIPEILISYPGSKFAVGKGTGPPLSKLNIAFRVQASTPPESLYMPHPFLNRSSPLDYRRSQTISGETYRSKKACGPHSHDDNFPVADKSWKSSLRLF
jgi:hypothetical protein